MTKRAFYNAMMGGFWRLTEDQWKTMVRDAIQRGECPNPDNYSPMLKGRPHCIYRVAEPGHREQFGIVHSVHQLRTPLD